MSPSLAMLVNSCRAPFIGFQSPSVSISGFLQLLGIASVYLSELFVQSSSCPGWRSLRSAPLVVTYLIPRSYMATKENRAFLAAGPSIWNGLPLELRSLPRDL